MAKAAKSAELKKAFPRPDGAARRAASGDVELIGRRAQAKTCEAIKGILEGGRGNYGRVQRQRGPGRGPSRRRPSCRALRDSHYGTLKPWAGQLGLKDAVSLLDDTLQEEKETNALLSSLAESSVNQEAAWRRLAPGAFAAAQGGPAYRKQNLPVQRRTIGFQGRSPDGPRGSSV
jgi:ferritin-like metal-binding protein YciE